MNMATQDPSYFSSSISQIEQSQMNIPIESIPVPYGWQRRILTRDLVVYLSPTNAILDSLESIRRYLEMPNSCKCGLQCPLIVEKVFNFDPLIQSKSWEVTQVLEGTHCRQKSNILEMATLTNCIDSFEDHEQKSVKRRKGTNHENPNGNVFVCTSNESVVVINSTGTTPSKRPRGRPRKTVHTSPILPHLAMKSSSLSDCHQPVPSSILSPPASVSSLNAIQFVHPKDDLSSNLKIDFNDPSTTNFLLSALASGASSDSNAIVKHLFEKAQHHPSPVTTETINLLPSDHKQQIFFLNNKPYIIQQSEYERPLSSRLDDAGHYFIVNGHVQPRTLNTLLKTLKNSSSYSGVDHLIETIQRFEQSTSMINNRRRTPVKKPSTTNTVRRRLTKKMKEEEQTNEVMLTPVQTDLNSLDLSHVWQNDPNFNSLLFHDDFDLNVSFDDFDPYLTTDHSSSETNLIFASHLL